MERIHCREGGFFDSSGRQRIFHGVNMVYKAVGPGPWNEADYQYLASQGYNIVRFGLLWASIEPQPLHYNDAYLSWVREQMDFCAQYGLYVVLDMHQDLFSQAYGDGAPEWATHAKGEIYRPTEPWSMAYLTNRAVMNACDSFWSNDNGPDGVSLQDHFAGMWGYTAKQLGGHPALLGYDLFNEPFPGSPGQAVVADLLERVGRALKIEQPERLLEDDSLWCAALKQLDEEAVFRAVMEAPSPAMERFERDRVQLLYQRTAQQIRQWDQAGILFWEHCYFGNLGLPTSIRPLPGGQQAYAPHGYDLTVDTPMAPYAGSRRVEAIFALQWASAQRLGLPVLVGEWGAFYQLGEGLEQLQDQLSIFDRYQWSHTYWSYEQGCHQNPAERVLRRPYPMAVAGRLSSFCYDPCKRLFSLAWEAGPGETILLLPDKPVQVTGLDRGTGKLTGMNGAYRLVLPEQAAGQMANVQIQW